MSEYSKQCETFEKVVYNKCPDGCVCVCTSVKISKNSNVCISRITQPMELKFGTIGLNNFNYRVK